MTGEKYNDWVPAFDVGVRDETVEKGYDVGTGWDSENVGGCGCVARACWTQNLLDSLPRDEEVIDKVFLHCQSICHAAAQWIRCIPVDPDKNCPNSVGARAARL